MKFKNILLTIVLASLTTLVSMQTSARPILDPGDLRQIIKKNKTKSLKCESGNAKWFSAILDSTSFASVSGYFVVTNAQLRDNYYTSERMHCKGNLIDDVSCVGYINGIDDLIEIKLSKIRENNQIVAIYNTVRGNGPGPTALQCIIN